MHSIRLLALIGLVLGYGGSGHLQLLGGIIPDLERLHVIALDVVTAVTFFQPSIDK